MVSFCSILFYFDFVVWHLVGKENKLLRCFEVFKDNKHSKEDIITSVHELNPLFFNRAVTGGAVMCMHQMQCADSIYSSD